MSIIFHSKVGGGGGCIWSASSLQMMNNPLWHACASPPRWILASAMALCGSDVGDDTVDVLLDV